VSPITQGLIITGIGMGLVFVAILALWGLMTLLVKVTADRPKVQVPPEMVEETVVQVVAPASVATNDNKHLHQAAAAAVAIALQLQQSSIQSQRQEFGSLSSRQAISRAAFISRSTQLIKQK
jgi:Na+-transporting methylmalonyl-CoA/oxaloacetate decarboxylase gamma subunit